MTTREGAVMIDGTSARSECTPRSYPDQGGFVHDLNRRHPSQRGRETPAPRSSLAVMGKRPEAKADGQPRAVPTPASPAPNKERAPNADTGESKARGADRPLNRLAPATPNSSSAKPRAPSAPSQTGTASPRMPANPSTTHFRTGPQEEWPLRQAAPQSVRTFERPINPTPSASPPVVIHPQYSGMAQARAQSVAPAPARPQFSPTPGPTPQRNYSSPAPRAPSVEMQRPSAPSSPPAMASTPSRSSAAPQSTERGDRPSRDRQAR